MRHHADSNHSPIHQLENQRQSVRVPRSTSARAVCNIVAKLLYKSNSNLRNLSYLYATTGTISHRTIICYVSLNTTITTVARSRCRGLLTTFSTLFEPHGLLSLFSPSPASYPRCLQYNLPISTKARPG